MQACWQAHAAAGAPERLLTDWPGCAGLARVLSIVYIILCNLLLINLLIALLNNTFGDVQEQVQQKQVHQRTQARGGEATRCLLAS